MEQTSLMDQMVRSGSAITINMNGGAGGAAGDAEAAEWMHVNAAAVNAAAVNAAAVNAAAVNAVAVNAAEWMLQSRRSSSK